MKNPTHPWPAYFVVLFPWQIVRSLAALRDNGYPDPLPNLWQVGLGILRMLHRLLFRTDTIGTCRQQPVRDTRRARVLQYRALRLPCLIWERAVFPLDLSGLASTRENTIRHLLAAHHDGNQFAYDLEMLMYQPGALLALRERVAAIVSGADPRAEWLRDLVVFEGYHEHLLAARMSMLALVLALAAHRHFPSESLIESERAFTSHLLHMS